MLGIGDKFPDFKLQDQDDNWVTKSDTLGSKTIYYFYPKDDTPGCTVEACEIRDSMPHFEGVKVFGISPDSAKSHKKFVDKFSLNFRLLSDIDKLLCEACGVWSVKSMYGKAYMGVERTTFLVDEKGVVIKVWNKVKPQGHSAELREALSAQMSA
ncbi:MAG: thioredoxin-dependent thiol peroxidase [Armatimonadetes bacterium]|nr:thioredoxin-dependent thiol peroxidase [Armatimonadota bacterium]